MTLVSALRRRWFGWDRLGRDVLLFCLGFALLRFWALAGRSPVRWPDSNSYFYVDFFGHAAGGRLWTVPVLYTTLPSDAARVAAQGLIGILCWSALAFAVARSLAHPVVARIGAIAILLLGLCIQVTEWDQTLLSESLAVSLGALLAAALLRTRLRRTWPVICATLVVLVLWMFARQVQVLVFLPVGVVTIGWMLLRARRYIAVAVALALIGVWGGYAAAQDKGNLEFGAHDILIFRILQTADGPAFIARSGMPDVPQLEKEASTYASAGTYLGGASKVYKDPRWQQWIDRHWSRLYLKWLIHHPVADIREPLSYANQLLSGFPNYASIRPVLPSTVQDLLWERASGDIPLWFGVTAVAWIASLRKRRPHSLDALAAGGIVISMFWYLAAWLLEPSELARLVIPAATMLRISLLLLLFTAIDRLVTTDDSGHPLGIPAETSTPSSS